MPSRIPWLLSLLSLACVGLGQGFRVKDLPKELPFTPPKKWAMVIGANDYTELGKLTYATADAKAFAKVLKERFGFQSESIDLITDDGGSALRPTRLSIEEAVNKQLADPRMNEGDLFIFYFSGHGIGTPAGDYLMPTNATAASAESAGVNVKELIQKFVKAGLRNVLFIVDACRSGDKNPFGEDLRKLGKQANIAVILGCEPGQRSYEYPQLGHGVFTSFLLKALTSKNLESPVTGALWASDVAAEVGVKVRSYTERDHPTQPQTPTGWSEKTMDVLLGAFPSKAEGRLKLNDILAGSERLDQDAYVNSLRIFAEALYTQGRFEDAVETYRAIDALKKLQPSDRFYFAVALMQLGRTFEHNNQLAILARDQKEPFYSLLASAITPSWLGSAEERVKGAMGALEKERNQWTALVAWLGLQSNVSPDDENRFLREALKLKDLSDDLKLLFEGRIAFNSGSYAEAITLWNSIPIAEDAVISPTFVKSFVFQAQLATGPTGDVENFLRLAAKEDPSAADRWYLILAQRLKDQGKFGPMLEAIRASLGSNPEPQAILSAVRVAGIRCHLIKDLVTREANKHPYAWKALVAKLWVEKPIVDLETWDSAINEAEKYNEDAFAVRYEFYRLADVVFDEAREAGKLPHEEYDELALKFSTDMAQNVEKLGYDSLAWQLMTKFMLSTLQFEKMAALYNSRFGEALEKNGLPGPMRAPYLMVALCVGDDDRIQKLWKSPGFYHADDADTALAYSIYLAMKGDLTRAKEVQPKAPVSAVFLPAQRAFRAYLDCLEGKPADLATIKTASDGHPEAQQLIALAYVHQKDWTHADSLLVQCAFQPLPIFNFIHAKALEAYLARLLAGKKVGKAAEVAQYVSTTFFGTPSYARIHFGPSPNLASYSGRIEFDAREVEVLPVVKAGSLSLAIDAKGKVSGKATIDGKERTIEGSIDAFGNLKASMKEGNQVWTMSGKIAQPDAYKNMDVLASGVQAFLLLDAKGQSRFLFGRAK